jgi:hypothetical protein
MNHFLRTRAMALLLILSVVALLGAVACQGKQGIEGPPGVGGNPGAYGAKGDPGPRGIQGIKGDPGPRGIQGIKGDAGAKGAQGLTGTAQITLVPMSAAGPAPSFNIYGSGFQNDEAILASVEGYSAALASTLVGGAIADASGAFQIKAKLLKEHTLAVGVYTVKVVGSEGSETTAALIVTAAEK